MKQEGGHRVNVHTTTTQHTRINVSTLDETIT